jgi:hypothetical protein
LHRILKFDFTLAPTPVTTKAVGCIARDESRDYSVDEPNGGTALMLAVDNGHHLAVEVLIAAGANVSASDTMG